MITPEQLAELDARNLCRPVIEEIKQLREIECRFLILQYNHQGTERENQKLRELLGKILGFNRARGYPTGIEWNRLIEEIDESVVLK